MIIHVQCAQKIVSYYGKWIQSNYDEAEFPNLNIHDPATDCMGVLFLHLKNWRLGIKESSLTMRFSTFEVGWSGDYAATFYYWNRAVMNVNCSVYWAKKKVIID